MDAPPADPQDDMAVDGSPQTCISERGWLCEAHGVGLFAMEDGLGKLRSGGRNKRLNHKLNAWDLATLKAMLERRLGLRGASLMTVRGVLDDDRQRSVHPAGRLRSRRGDRPARAGSTGLARAGPRITP